MSLAQTNASSAIQPTKTSYTWDTPADTALALWGRTLDEHYMGFVHKDSLIGHYTDTWP
jgi:hypothetical protein